MKKQIKTLSLLLIGIVFLLPPAVIGNSLHSSGFYKSGELPGDYIGEFVCIQAQGKSGLTITIIESDDGKISAVCKFYPHKSNPDIAIGSFNMDVKLNGNEISFMAKEWINQPENYNMFNVTGIWDSKNNTITGNIHNKPFKLEKYLIPGSTEKPRDDS